MIVAAFLFPLALYCGILGLINRRRRPLMVSAAWDFAGILFAASGFLLFGGPALLTGFSERWREAWLVGRVRGGTDIDALTGFLAVAYFVAVVGAAGFVIWRRQAQTAVYNVHPDVFDEALAGVLDAGGLLWSRAGNRYFIRRGAKERVFAEEGAGDPPAPVLVRDALPPPEERGERGGYPSTAEEIERSAYLEVDPSPALCHVTLTWEAGDDDLRRQVEAELARALEDVRTHDNPVGNWLLTTAASLLCAAAFAVVLAVIYTIRR